MPNYVFRRVIKFKKVLETRKEWQIRSPTWDESHCLRETTPRPGATMSNHETFTTIWSTMLAWQKRSKAWGTAPAQWDIMGNLDATYERRSSSVVSLWDISPCLSSS